LSAIEVKNVSKSFQLGDITVKALIDINLEFDKAGINALMGPSGSGKSTLLNLIGALDTPSVGKVLIKNSDIGTLSMDERAVFRNSTCGFIFQNFNLIPVLTTLENVLLPTYFSKEISSNKHEDRAKELLEKVGLKDQIHQSVNRLSGGQMQRVAIARSLINNPAIILADEPTANLDHKTANTVLEVLRELCTSEGKIVIMATHDHSVLPFCSRITHLRDGKFLKEETPPEGSR
jgi:putative ABC transport system ATP-binding protein